MRFALAFLAPATVLAATLPISKRTPGIAPNPNPGLTPATNLPNGFQYAGCYTDNGGRVLQDAYYGDGTSMTDESCVSFCNARGYAFAGTEYAQECFCGSKLQPSAAKVADSECSFACKGNADEPCGAGFRLTVFTNGASGPQTKTGTVNGYTYQGCYSDGPNTPRVLAHGVQDGTTAPKMSVELCTSLCQNAGYSIAGVEYAGECFCDNTLASTSQLQTGDPDTTRCNMACNGDKTEYCGGPNRLNVYAVSPIVTSTSTSSTSSSSISTSTSTSTSTVSKARVSETIRLMLSTGSCDPYASHHEPKLR